MADLSNFSLWVNSTAGFEGCVLRDYGARQPSDDCVVCVPKWGKGPKPIDFLDEIYQHRPF